MVLVKNGHCLLSVNAKGVFTVLQGTNFGLDSSQYKYLLDPLQSLLLPLYMAIWKPSPLTGLSIS